MKLVKTFKFVIVILFVAVNSYSMQAQGGNVQGGNVQGTIVDEHGLSIPFGEVVIESLHKGVISDVNGKFVFIDLPEGSYTINVYFLGYADKKVEAIVKSGVTTVVNIKLTQKTQELDGVEVFGRNGQFKALNAQKNKQNITNIVSTDQIGKFPDANIGDAIKRIPGITMQVDQGEARNVIIRGLAPQLNSVTLNGSRVPSAEGDNRNVQMDLIPSDMIQTIEVNKAVTPDMDADALGGSVNLVTRNSPRDFRLSATVGSGINFITNKRVLNGSFIIGDRSKNEKLGWMVSASIHDNDFGSHNIEAEWDDKFEYYTGEDDDDGEPILDEVDVNPYVKEFQQRTYLVQRIRKSFSVNLDYAFNANTIINFKSMYNWRDDRENRFRLKQEIFDAEDIELGDFTVTDRNLVRFPIEARRQTKGGIDNGRNKNKRLEDQRMQNYSLSGDHLFGKLKFNWMASFAAASEERLDERYISYKGKYIIKNDVSDSKFPLFSPENAEDATPENFKLKEITGENKFTEEKDINFFADFELPANFFDVADGILKFGGRFRIKNKERTNNFFEYEALNEDRFKKMSNLSLVDKTDENYLAGSQYKAGQYVDPKVLGKLDFNDNTVFDKKDVPDEYVRANYEVEENVYAGYVMSNQQLSKKLSVLAGVRLEHTTITATGNQILDEEDVVGKIIKESKYTNVLPGVHLKFDATDKTIFRFAWTNTLARPNYKDLVPSEDIIEDDEEIYRGNPELKAATAMSFDLMAEHYYSNVGILSGGLFYKNINDFVYDYQTKDATTGFDLYQPENGDKAAIFGAEIAYQRQLDFLPGFAKNFSLMLNYTYLNSSAEGIRNEDGKERDDVDLPGTAPHMFNSSLAYTGKKLNVRISANFSDAYIDEIGGSAFEDRYYDQQFLLDFNASFSINKSLSIYFDLNNITDQPLRYYQGIKERTMQSEWYGRKITFGLKYNLFGK